MAGANESLKDELFNAKTLEQLANEYASGLPRFDKSAFANAALSGVPDRSLLACLDWFADCITPYLAQDFPTMAEQLEAMMPPPLDAGRSDDDFGQFIHAVPGIMAVRHGLGAHTSRALDLLYAATQRFSMEFYVRPFLNAAQEETLERMHDWAGDANYHVRRLVSEGTRPKLPWAKKIDMPYDRALPFLDRLHADPTRYVTRSVANHCNDIAKIDPQAVLGRLSCWQERSDQSVKELDWMRRHALRGLVKQGHSGALEHLGYKTDVDVVANVSLEDIHPRIGEDLNFSVELTAAQDLPVMVDYRLVFHRPNGRSGEKVFKLKSGRLKANQTTTLRKKHKLKSDATTFTLYPGPHRLILQVNGADRAHLDFELR